MKILCLDPSLRAFGWAIIENSDITAGNCIITSDENSDTIAIATIAEELQRIINEYKPESIYFEIASGSKSTRANQALAYVRGIVVTLATVNKLPHQQFRAKEIKKILSLDANAKKDQILEIIRKKLPSFDKITKEMPKFRVYAVSDAAATYFGK